MYHIDSKMSVSDFCINGIVDKFNYLSIIKLLIYWGVFCLTKD